MKRKSTMIELVEELQKLPQSVEIDLMIQEAKAGEFHDYKNQKYVCGKLGYIELAKCIENGEFDESPDEEDDKRMQKQALEDGMPAEMLKMFGLETKH